MYLDQNTAPFFNGSNYQPFGPNQGDDDLERLRMLKTQGSAQSAWDQAAANRGSVPPMNVSDPSLWQKALATGAATQAPGQTPGVATQMPGGPGLNIDQLKAKGINVPETHQAFSGTDLVSTTRMPMGGGYRAGDMLSKETTMAMDPISIASRLRAGGGGSLQQFMPAATNQSNKLIEEMGKQQTLRDVEDRKAQVEDKRLTRGENRQDRQFETAQTKQDQAEEVRLRADRRKEYLKENPKATPEDIQRVEDEAGGAFRKQLGASRAERQANKKAGNAPPAAATPAGNAPPPPPGPAPLEQRDIDRLMALVPSPGNSPRNLNVDALLKELMPEYQAGRVTPEVAALMSRKLAHLAGGDQQLMEGLGPRLAAAQLNSGGQYKTGAGTLQFPTAPAKNWLHSPGVNVGLNGQNTGWMPRAWLDDYPMPSADMPDTSGKTAGSQLLAELLAPRVRDMIGR